MKLSELLTQIKNQQGYVYHRLLTEDRNVKTFSIWVTRNNFMQEFRLRVLVLDEGQPSENVVTYGAELADIQGSFRAEVESKIPAYLTAHPEIEKIVLVSVNEYREIASLDAYEYDAVTNKTTIANKIVYRKDSGLVVRTLAVSASAQ